MQTVDDSWLPAAAWVALLPAPTRPAPALCADEEPRLLERDPAAKDREPLTVADYHRAFTASPVHRAVLWGIRNVPSLNSRMVLRALYYTAPAIVVPSSVVGIMLDSGFFDLRGVVAGLVGYVFVQIFHAVALTFGMKAAVAMRKDLDLHPFAVYVRWYHLCVTVGTAGGGPDVELGGASDWNAALLAHNAEDPFCLCPAPSCAGSVLRTSAAAQVAFALFEFLSGLCTWVVLALWTPVVFLAAEMWTTWRAGFAAWTIFVTVACHVSLLSEIATTDVALLGLESRLKHRVLKLALAGLVSRATRSSARGETISWPFTEPYIDVQMAFAPSWRSNKSSTEIGLVLFVVAASTTALSSLASLLGSGCIPAFYISTVAMDLVFCIRYVSDAIVANGGVSSAVDLYRRTRTTLAGLLALDPDHPERRRLRAHAELLARYEAACSEDLAMLFGFVVRYGVLRGLLVTGLTVGIGLFGILRGAGARVTLQTVCPVA